MILSLFVRNITYNGIHLNNVSISMNNRPIFAFDSIPLLTMNNISLTNTTLESLNVRWIGIRGMFSTVSLSQIDSTNVGFHGLSAIGFFNLFLSITINEIHFDNITVGSDISIFEFDSLKVLNMRDVKFSNIMSQSTESSNNYMIGIIQTGKSYQLKNYLLLSIKKFVCLCSTKAILQYLFFYAYRYIKHYAHANTRHICS